MPSRTAQAMALLSWLLFARLGCVGFTDYSQGDLCEKAARDEQGRAIYYPESRICPALVQGADAGTR